MISALEKLKLNLQLPQANDQPAVASLKISGKAGGMLRLFSTHPDLDDRIQALRKSQTIGML
jgi:Zn-dependent protease with chaperone function